MATVIYGDFEWEDQKAAANIRKHGVSFEEASTIFADPCYIMRQDDMDPDRFFAIGTSGVAHLLTVIHAERGQRVRIISARNATKSESKTYERRRF